MTRGSHPLVYLSTLSPFGTAHPVSLPSPRPRRSLSRASTKRNPRLCRHPHRHRDYYSFWPFMPSYSAPPRLRVQTLTLNTSFLGGVLARRNLYFHIPSRAHLRLHIIVTFSEGEYSLICVQRMQISSHIPRYKPFPASSPRYIAFPGWLSKPLPHRAFCIRLIWRSLPHTALAYPNQATFIIWASPIYSMFYKRYSFNITA